MDAQTLQRLAAVERLTPAVITRSARVARKIHAHLPQAQGAGIVERLVENNLVAQGYPKISLSVDQDLPPFYDPACLNVDVDLAALADGVAATSAARLCLYGPPGTCKSGFARWLSDKVARPIYVKRVSDLVTPYVGGTEQNIAAAFREAAADSATLLFDEIDSFLLDRRTARHRWEITEVNEMLIQMEYFPGVFVATTNAMADIDQAALRRFDVKLRFDYLLPDQAWPLFVHHVKALELPPPGKQVEQDFKRLTVLTPGDFLTVARRARFRPLEDAEGFLEALCAECEMKEGRKQKRIGFV